MEWSYNEIVPEEGLSLGCEEPHTPLPELATLRLVATPPSTQDQPLRRVAELVACDAPTQKFREDHESTANFNKPDELRESDVELRVSSLADRPEQ